MKLKLDENLGNLGRDLLQSAGHDVSTVALQQLSGRPDTDIYAVCLDEQRILVTLDRDFGETMRFPPEATAGIVVLACHGRLTPENILARLRELAVCPDQQTIEGSLWIVEPGRVRIHEKRNH